MSYKNIQNCLKCCILAVSLLVFHPTRGQSSYGDLDQAIQARRKELPKEFVMQLWKRDDTLVYQKISGELTGRSSLPLASSSSWLTAALVMVFVDEGKLSLDDKITKWLPEFEKYGKNYITIRHCLSHQTGIQSELSVTKLLSRKKFGSLEDEVNAFAAREIQSNPGTEFRYSNVGLNIAGRVLEVISKKKFDQLIKQKLFTPMKMRNTSFSNLSGGAVSPSEGAVSTADDYMKFLVMLLNKGTYHGRRILSETAVSSLLEQQVQPSMIKYVPKVADGFSYAAGSWIITPPVNADEKIKPTVFAAPGLYGSWPMIDVCRGYAYLVLVNESKDEDRSRVHLQLKSVVDANFTESCLQ